MSNYTVWDVDSDEDSGWQVPAAGTPNLHWWEVARDAESASEVWAQNHWSDHDHPETMECFVRAPDGTVTRWKVHAEQTVTFSASQSEDPADE